MLATNTPPQPLEDPFEFRKTVRLGKATVCPHCKAGQWTFSTETETKCYLCDKEFAPSTQSPTS